MGYNTEYTGVMKFVTDPSLQIVRELDELFGEDIRDHPEWKEYLDNDPGFCYIDLRITKKMDGIEWNSDTEKTYDLAGQLNFVMNYVNSKDPNRQFGLKGKIRAQGEDIDDLYYVVCDGNQAYVEKITPEGTKITCPHCEQSFYSKFGTLEETQTDNAEKINRAVYIKILNELQEGADPESAHARADNLLMEILVNLGYKDIVDAYDKINKWYA